ncbi:hypothetical protein HCG51_21200 [Tolypothrix sp. PCC 7910]|uniref:hypothetical protein n=1 Tax=Tolypothrix sp. PCC 7910 TaxID=2099387 RepID=UPI0014276FEC|nr:hypothetical protein [Tolypothrix sp. PCC 7910]QIR38968.1 hypothetical protein HCG51_21200 [Tolypothrix sp. PCC 7910]
MDNFDGILDNLETEINKISEQIKVDFGNKKLMIQQLEFISNHESKLKQNLRKINGIISSTEIKKNDFPTIATIAGGLLALFGGPVSGLGLDLAGESISNYNDKENKIKSIRQKAISLQSKIESIILYIQNLKYVANKSFSNQKLMMYLATKNYQKNIIIAITSLFANLFLVIDLIILVSSITLIFTGQFTMFLMVLVIVFFLSLIIGYLYSIVEKCNNKWQVLIAKVAANCLN